MVTASRNTLIVSRFTSWSTGEAPFKEEKGMPSGTTSKLDSNVEEQMVVLHVLPTSEIMVV